MRVILGFLAGFAGMLVGWFAVAALVIMIWGSGMDGGIAMAGIFQAGPLGGIVGFVVGLCLFLRRRVVR